MPLRSVSRSSLNPALAPRKGRRLEGGTNIRTPSRQIGQQPGQLTAGSLPPPEEGLGASLTRRTPPRPAPSLEAPALQQQQVKAPPPQAKIGDNFAADLQAFADDPFAFLQELLTPGITLDAEAAAAGQTPLDQQGFVDPDLFFSLSPENQASILQQEIDQTPGLEGFVVDDATLSNFSEQRFNSIGILGFEGAIVLDDQQISALTTMFNMTLDPSTGFTQETFEFIRDGIIGIEKFNQEGEALKQEGLDTLVDGLEDVDAFGSFLDTRLENDPFFGLISQFASGDLQLAGEDFVQNRNRAAAPGIRAFAAAENARVGFALENAGGGGSGLAAQLAQQGRAHGLRARIDVDTAARDAQSLINFEGQKFFAGLKQGTEDQNTQFQATNNALRTGYISNIAALQATQVGEPFDASQFIEFAAAQEDALKQATSLELSQNPLFQAFTVMLEVLLGVGAKSITGDFQEFGSFLKG